MLEEGGGVSVPPRLLPPSLGTWCAIPPAGTRYDPAACLAHRNVYNHSPSAIAMLYTHVRGFERLGTPPTVQNPPASYIPLGFFVVFHVCSPGAWEVLCPMSLWLSSAFCCLSISSVLLRIMSQHSTIDRSCVTPSSTRFIACPIPCTTST